jgi:hypothetical protein
MKVSIFKNPILTLLKILKFQKFENSKKFQFTNFALNFIKINFFHNFKKFKFF